MLDQRSGVGRPSELTGELGDLAERFGGVEGLASELGVTARSVQRYNSGSVFPPDPVLRLLAALATSAGVDASAVLRVLKNARARHLSLAVDENE